jgi:hypothetical protein
MLDETKAKQDTTYTPLARHLHWWTALFVAVQIPMGLYMTYRGGVLNVFDVVTDTLYDSHKLLGLVIFLLVIARLLYRLAHGAPPNEPTLERWHKGASHTTHWGLFPLRNPQGRRTPTHAASARSAQPMSIRLVGVPAYRRGQRSQRCARSQTSWKSLRQRQGLFRRRPS